MKEEIKKMKEEIKKMEEEGGFSPKLQAAKDLLRGAEKEKDPEQVASSVRLARRYVQAVQRKSK